MNEYEFKVEDFCYNTFTVTVRARTRGEASDKLQEQVTQPIS